ncbi:DUF3806 domain-containing protein [Candidatus Sumerlaeota bacterium]|nr:DUF3806 domain-containing protein [Candidatus Sumerlaeota bacterium]
MATPDFTEISAALRADIREDALDLVRYLKRNEGVDLDFDEKSVVWLSSYIERDKSLWNDTERDNFGLKIGLVLGEAIITRHEGSWVLMGEKHGNQPAIRFESGALTFPVGKAFRQIENGLSDNIYGLYRNIGMLLKGLPRRE